MFPMLLPIHTPPLSSLPCSPLFCSICLFYFQLAPESFLTPRPSLSSCLSSALPLSFSSSPLCSWAAPVDALHLVLIKVAEGRGLGVVTDGWERQWMWGKMARDGFNKSLSLVCIKCFLIMSYVVQYCSNIIFGKISFMFTIFNCGIHCGLSNPHWVSFFYKKYFACVSFS